MSTILIINDNSSEARHAAEFALIIAQKMQADILLLNTIEINEKDFCKVPADAFFDSCTDNCDCFPYPVSDKVVKGELFKPCPDACNCVDYPASGVRYRLKTLNDGTTNFKPRVEEVDVSFTSESEVIELVIKRQVWMIIKGMANTITEPEINRTFNVHSVLNRVLCPLLLVPETWPLKNIERLTYIADLRYCRIQIVRYLAALAKPWNANLSIGHVTAPGLTEMAEAYAREVFAEEVCKKVNYDQLFFNNIREKDLLIAVDVIVNGMQNDLLVLVNRHFHFEEIVGRYITNILPGHITVPLLVFPF
ncbi:hypothetical protein G7092_17340 [Mucilaginibacter sp. HC2]|uniref:hypothetical protein n=1 Tax=Mucilaginibacter TaxID=423349 RepID=UPI000DCD3E0B|nr:MULTISPECIES: hypothetical protein [Mucilaginibacter]NHA05579.1 hypothetical protein [Mucilaginibacter inviolabilis]QTE35387.1 hypothetical protein J3L18_19820 [Mucilaginibacter gossypii]RAV59413.1 hypothetical protein DIU36_06180 [Mucilaginibacter rubeus]